MATTAIQTPTDRTAGFVAGSIETVLLRVVALHRRRVTRRQLESLTLEQLRDVGIDPDVISRDHDVPGDPWTMSQIGETPSALQSLMRISSAAFCLKKKILQP